MNETVILIVTDAFGTVSKSFERRLEKQEVGGRIKTIESTEQPEYLEVSQRPEETWYC